MSDVWVWITIVGLTGATIVTRAALFVLGDRVQLPTRLERALRYAPACALTAILVPDLAFTAHGLDVSLHNLRMLAAIASAAFFVVTRDMLWTIVFGMVVFTALRLFT